MSMKKIKKFFEKLQYLYLKLVMITLPKETNYSTISAEFMELKLEVIDAVAKRNELSKQVQMFVKYGSRYGVAVGYAKAFNKVIRISDYYNNHTITIGLLTGGLGSKVRSYNKYNKWKDRLDDVTITIHYSDGSWSMCKTFKVSELLLGKPTEYLTTIKDTITSNSPENSPELVELMKSELLACILDNRDMCYQGGLRFREGRLESLNITDPERYRFSCEEIQNAID